MERKNKFYLIKYPLLEEKKTFSFMERKNKFYFL